MNRFEGGGMRTRRQQRGMTFWGLLFVLGVIAFFTFLTFKLFPVYLQDFKVKAAMDGLARNPDISHMTKSEMVESLKRRFQIDDVEEVDPATIVVEVRGRTKAIRLRYERVVPLAFNISALLEFDHTREVAASE
jgi:hypothetical protein